MLLNNLPVGPAGQVLFDSAERADALLESHAEDVHEHADNFYDVQAYFPDPPASSITLCPRFLAFHASKVAAYSDATDASADASQTRREVSFAAMEDSTMSACTFEYEEGDMHAGGALGVLVPPVFDSFTPTEDGGSGAFDDDDDHHHGSDMYDGGDDVSALPPLDSSMSMSRASLDSTASFRAAATDLVAAGVELRTDSDYEFFDAAALPGWAGPEHWRYRAGLGGIGSRTASGTQKKESKRPRSKTAMLLDFSQSAPEMDFSAEFAPAKTKSSITLSKTVLNSFTERRVTLPEDVHYSARMLSALFLRPNVRIKRRFDASHQKEGGFDDADNAAPWYDYDNDCDNENYVPALLDDDDMGGGGGGGVDFGGDHNDEDARSQTADGLQLVPEPRRVERLDIAYAKVAKKVDVRQLKSGMWSKLCGGAEDDADEIGIEKSKSTDTDKDEGSMQGESQDAPDKARNTENDVRNGARQTLKQLVGELPTYVPATALAGVSLPYVFICLLHLANEKCLAITPADNTLTDLVISQDENAASCPPR